MQIKTEEQKFVIFEVKRSTTSEVWFNFELPKYRILTHFAQFFLNKLTLFLISL